MSDARAERELDDLVPEVRDEEVVVADREARARLLDEDVAGVFSSDVRRGPLERVV